MLRSTLLKDGYSLVEVVLTPTSKPEPLAKKTAHIWAFDVSGSMTADLPGLAQQLGLKLPTLIREGDTFSAIWFSGRGEAGTIFEHAEIATLRDLKKVTDALKRWLRPVGLTGFKDPLDLSVKLAEEATKNGFAVSYAFASDGLDNQNLREDILVSAKRLAPFVASAAFVEYGYYAGRALLAEMAAAVGGSMVFAKDLAQYEPMLEAELKSQPLSAPRVAVGVPDDAECGFVFSYDASGGLYTYSVESGTASVPEGTPSVFYVTKKTLLKPSKTVSAEMTSALYAGLSVYAARMRPDIIYPLLGALGGDVRFVKEFGVLFGKQKYTEFQEAARRAVWEPGERGRDGFDPKALPADNAVTVLDLLDVLLSDESSRVLMDDPEFKYSKISRAREEVVGEGVSPLKFVAAPKPDGYEINGLTYNSDRANISILIRKEGTIDLGERLPFEGKVPRQFPTHILRNYALIVDGLVNVSKLPVRVSKPVLDKLLALEVPVTGDTSKAVVDLSKMPILNRKRVSAASATVMLEEAFTLLKCKARQKVFNHYAEALAPKDKAVGLQSRYGREESEWLAAQGLTANGFQPPRTKQADVRDFYLAKELSISIKGWSSLPKVDDALKGKGGAPGAEMKLAIDEIEARKAGAKGPAGEKAFKSWLEAEQRVTVLDCRERMVRLAQAKIAVIVGGAWFKEFDSPDVGVLTLKTADGTPVVGSFEMSEPKVFV